jgi:hypothetical protein
MNVFDEEVLSFTVQHEEGQVPTLDLSIRNPRVGLLLPSRKVWAWLGWQKPNVGLVPLFFGVLVGVPTNLFKETITLKFIARSPTFIADKQAVAETMRVAPYYDPIWLDDRHRDDPDSVLEGWSALWHVDRLTLATTASDVLEGEDGTVTFDENEALYDSVGLSLGEPPLVNVRVEASVSWQQRSSGFIPVPQVNVASYTGETFFSGWPQAGSGIGGGYKVESSFATDIYHVAQTPQTSYQSNWTNTDPNPGQCSNASATSQSSGPALLSPNALTAPLTGKFTTGICDPFSDPPTNTPMTISVSGIVVPEWFISADMTLRYDSSRQYSELLSFDMIANVQSVLAAPTVDQNTELLTIASVDVGKPLLNILAWTSLANTAVPLAQIIWPNNPTKPGGLAYQICVTAGTAGSTEPTFSDIPGITTADNSVLWASLGTSGLTMSSRWSPGAGTPVGQIMLLQDQSFNEASGSFEDIPGRTVYYLCTTSGTTNGVYRTFSYIPPVGNNDAATPEPRIISTIDPPAYVTSPGSHVTDGTVVWTVLGTNPPILNIPIGGTPDTVVARSFFPTARGQRAIQYLICRARARLRYRARAVKVDWSTSFDLATTLSCRKNATLFDPRLPGGAATGKVIAYSFECDGTKGELRGHVTIGCAIGLGGSIVEITGSPVYAQEGYAQKGWQLYEGMTTATGNNDIAYSPPAFKAFDDGLQFPLRWQDISDGGVFSGDAAKQRAAIEASFAIAVQLKYIQAFGGEQIVSGNTTSNVAGFTADSAWRIEREQLALASLNTPYVMEANPVQWAFLIRPCAGNGPFSGAYAITVSNLVVPEGINLAAPSAP